MSDPKIKASSDAEWRYYYENKCRDARKEITHLELQLEDAKRTIEVLKEQIKAMAKKPDEPTVPDLAMLIARLVYQVGRFDHGNETAQKAMDYLRRKNLQQSVLRQAMGDAATPRCPVCGYSQADADIHGDHHLCLGVIPKEAAKP